MQNQYNSAILHKMQDNRRKIYVFIKEYGENRFVKLRHIQMYSDKNNITRREMGIAIKELKDNKAIFFNPKRGWIARS